MGKTALVLAGGGSRGSYQIGVWQALREMDIHPDMITGTSVGALNAAMIVQNDFDHALSLWSTLETSMVFDVQIDNKLPKKQRILGALKKFFGEFVRQGGVDNTPLRSILEQYIDEGMVRRAPAEFGLVTVEMGTGKPCQLWREDIPKGELIDFLLASSAIYPAVRAQEIDGVKYVDGGYYDNMPVEMALKKGADNIIAVDLEAIGNNLRGVLNLKQAKYVKHIKCYWDLGSILLFDGSQAKRNIRMGYLDTMRAFGIFEGFAYTFAVGTGKIMAEYYENYPFLLEMLGLKNGDKLADSLVGKVMKIGSKGPFSVENPSVAGAELAGEIFSVDFDKIYTVEIFNRNLHQKIDELTLPAGLFDEKAGGLEALRESLSLLDKKVRTLYLAKVFSDVITKQSRVNLSPLAALMTDEFLAAGYLLLSGILSM